MASNDHRLRTSAQVTVYPVQRVISSQRQSVEISSSKELSQRLEPTSIACCGDALRQLIQE